MRIYTNTLYIIFQKKSTLSTPEAIVYTAQGQALPTVDNLLVLSYLFGVTIDEIIVVDNDEQAQKSA